MQRIRIFIEQIHQFLRDVPVTAHERWEWEAQIHKLEAKLTETHNEQSNNGEH